MMREKNRKLSLRFISFLLVLLLVVSLLPVSAFAATTAAADDPFIVLSLGDSYASGEGVPPFYGQVDSVSQRVQSEDWLAHRSQYSWSSLLEFGQISGKLGNYHVEYGNGSQNAKWYFEAVSGAKTENIDTEPQKKTYIKGLTIGSKELPPQLDVVEEKGLYGKVDYVTISIGGNDVDFVGIVRSCVTWSTYLEFGAFWELNAKINKIWDDFDSVYSKQLEDTYEAIKTRVGPQAQILVTGYPQLFSPNGGGGVSAEEARIVNENVTEFNKRIAEIVGKCQDKGMKIEFVDVEAEFLKDGGHGAYSDVPWIREVEWGPAEQDLSNHQITSSYSMHPNEKGVEAYARCVNATIKEIEEENSKGTLSGKVCQAADRVTPIQNAKIEIYSGNTLKTTLYSQSDGNYQCDLPAGDYRIDISASGYIGFSCYATVINYTKTYTETFLMIIGDENETGTASGTIKHALTGMVESGVQVSLYENWNNTDGGTPVATAITDANGNYTISANLGNYTLKATKAGFVDSYFNIIVQRGTTDNQNGTISPEISGDDYLITLTWGASPMDMDSHVEGVLSDGSTFHKYYRTIGSPVMDNDETVCTLDCDDVTSYGPEHITLHTTTDQPYYYYVHQYSGDGQMSTSETYITVQQGNVVIAEFHVPTDQGDGRYWNVFAIVDGELVICNTITNRPDTSYAS